MLIEMLGPIASIGAYSVSIMTTFAAGWIAGRESVVITHFYAQRGGEVGSEEEHEQHSRPRLDSTGSAMVDPTYYWIPIDKDTPRGCKLQLRGQGGIAVYGNYNGDLFWTHWAPMPVTRKEDK